MQYGAFLKMHCSDRTLYFGIFICHFVVFWLLCGIFTVVDLQQPKDLHPFKTQETWYPTRKQLQTAVIVTLRNQTVTLLEMTFVWQFFSDAAPDAFAQELPTLFTVVVHLAVIASFTEVVFYTGHRLLHTPWWWKNVHYIHHQWHSPYALTAIFAHPIEHLMSNFFTLHVGALVMGSHITIWYLGALGMTAAVVIQHTGFHLPFIPEFLCDETHDYHHSQGFDNLGAFNLLDGICGTNASYLTSWQRTVDEGYTTPDYPVDKILARGDAQGLVREDSRPLQDCWRAFEVVLERTSPGIIGQDGEVAPCSLDCQDGDAGNSDADALRRCASTKQQ